MNPSECLRFIIEIHLFARQWLNNCSIWDTFAIIEWQRKIKPNTHTHTFGMCHISPTICKRHISRLVFQAQLYIKNCRFCYCHYCRHIFTTCFANFSFRAYGPGKILQLSHTGTSLFWFPAAHCVFFSFSSPLYSHSVRLSIRIDAYSMFSYRAASKIHAFVKQTNKKDIVLFCHPFHVPPLNQHIIYMLLFLGRKSGRWNVSVYVC